MHSLQLCNHTTIHVQSYNLARKLYYSCIMRTNKWLSLIHIQMCIRDRCVNIALSWLSLQRYYLLVLLSFIITHYISNLIDFLSTFLFTLFLNLFLILVYSNQYFSGVIAYPIIPCVFSCNIASYYYEKLRVFIPLHCTLCVLWWLEWSIEMFVLFLRPCTDRRV